MASAERAPKLPAPAGPAAVGDRLDPARARLVLLILSGAALMVTYVETMVVPALVRFQIFFDHPPISTVAWILSAYLLVGVVSTPIFGKLGDLYGKKRILVVVMSVYAVAVTFAGFTPDIASAAGISRGNAIYLLILVRGVQGLGMAMFPLAFAMVGEEFPPNKVAGAQGAISAMFAAGAGLGLAGGAYLTQTLGWQFTYHSVIPVAILMVILTIVYLRESRVRLQAKLDIPGATLLGGALATFLVALSEGGYWGWTNWSAASVGGLAFGVPDFFVLAIAFTVAFLLWEPRARAPIVDFVRLAERNIAISNAVAVTAGAAMFLIFVGTSLLAQLPHVGLGLSVLTYGLLALPTPIAMMVFAPIVGKSIGRFGPKPAMLYGAALMTVGGLLLAVFNRTWLELMLATIPAFVGIVTCFIAMTNVIVLSSRREETGIQTGMNATFRTLGQSLGPVMATAILSTASTTFFLTVVTNGRTVMVPATVPALVAFQYVFLAAALLGVVSFLLSLGLINFRYGQDGVRIDARRSSSGPAPAATEPAATSG
ncbi:MAG: MFS transporter [Thermoplasmata archaeon]|nr:MFS transporter [Thermoplasmata archaeon]